jgi:YidC/Oxa1 family membrane protein insertase
MEKRAILAIVLSLLVVIVWSVFFNPSRPRTPPPEQAEQAKQEAPPAPEEATPKPEQASPSAPPEETAMPTPPPEEALVTVDTGVARLALTNLGAGVRSVQLHEFKIDIAKGAPPVEIAPVPGATQVPLTAELHVGQRVESLYEVAFAPSTTALTLSERTPEGTVVFRGRLSNGAVVRRTYHFRYDSYAFEVETRLEGLQPADQASMVLWWGPGLLQHSAEKVSRRGQTAVAPRSYVSGKVFDKAPKEVGATQVDRGHVAWTALADTYFAAVLLPQQPAADAIMVRRVRADALMVGLQTPLRSAQPTQTVRVYVGPKKQQLLKAVEPSLATKLIDLGIFSPLARPMMDLLRLINGVVHNYGVTIILVTILIKIVFWPLTQKSYKSMQAMQKLQPKIKELQVVYKDDKQAMNQAMMKLYREQKVNPMGGCLPMLLQIPFFFAFYNALLYSIELRHAPFICWEHPVFWIGRGICDLSVLDPSYITPVLMGISMFVQQKMTPTTGDPTQAKFMQFMPLLFLFFFLKAPSGLVIYWLVNNVLSIVQQQLINRSRRLETAAKAKASG